MYTVEAIIKRINNRGYRINMSHVQKVLIETIKEGGELRKELTSYAQIDFTNNYEVIRFINHGLLGREAIIGKTISNKMLEGLYTQTQNSFFNSLIAYRKEHDRYNKITYFIKYVIDPNFNKSDKDCVKEFIEKKAFSDIRISPTAKLNSNSGISLSNPILPFSVDDIKNLIVDYNVAIPCENMEDILYILNKYGNLICGEDYLVIGTTFYANMVISEWNWIPFPSPEEEDIHQWEEFRSEFGVDGFGDKIVEKSKKVEIKEEKQGESFFAKQAQHVEQVAKKWNVVCSRLIAKNNEKKTI